VDAEIETIAAGDEIDAPISAGEEFRTHRGKNLGLRKGLHAQTMARAVRKIMLIGEGDRPWRGQDSVAARP